MVPISPVLPLHTTVYDQQLMLGFSLLFSSLLFHAGQAATKLPSAEASKRAQCTPPGQHTPYIKGIMKTPES